MKDNEIAELSPELLEAVSGGAWDSDTLTYEEGRRLDLLITRMVNAAANGPASKRKEYYADFNAYVATLEEKYGPSGWDWMSLILG